MGDCAQTCGVFKGSYAVAGSVDQIIPVDVFVRGCPPEPADILRGILTALDRAPTKEKLSVQRMNAAHECDTLFDLMLLAYAAGALAALAGRARQLGARAGRLGRRAGRAEPALALGVSVIASGTPFSLVLPDLLPIAGGLALQLDPLGAFFLILIGLGGRPGGDLLAPATRPATRTSGIAARCWASCSTCSCLSMSLVTMAG